jgi:hypothetical protein
VNHTVDSITPVLTHSRDYLIHVLEGAPVRLWIFIFKAHALNAEGWPGAVYTGSELSLGGRNWGERRHSVRLDIHRRRR